MAKLFSIMIALLMIILSTSIVANSVTVPLYLTTKAGRGEKSVGTVMLTDTQYGLLITPHLYNLPQGQHGFHVHVYPSCLDNGMAAGDHLDPQKTGKHLGPYNDKGHLGDLPLLCVNKKGMDTTLVLAPRLKVDDVIDHSLMIHAEGDNYADIPKLLGGGGARLACGVVKEMKI